MIGETKPDAQVWLKERLTEPRRVADLISEWCGGEFREQSWRFTWKQPKPLDPTYRWEGGEDGKNGHWIKDLNEARARLGLEAKIGDDDCWYWFLPDVDLLK